MRVLIDEVSGLTGAGAVSDEQLAALYAPPRTPWLRLNMVATADGSATGSGGRSGSINTPPDHRVFTALRRAADLVLVGAGTAEAEGYGEAEVPLALVSRRARVPEGLREARSGGVLLVTTAAADGLADARDLLGEEHVLVAGEEEVDLSWARRELHARGYACILSEGGPHLFADLVAAGAVDEVCLTTAPVLVGGEHPRIAVGPEVEARLRLAVLLEEDGTLLARWLLPS